MADHLDNTTDEFRIHVIDVGQGDSILLEGPDDDTMLIDSGPWKNNGETVLDYLDEHDIDHLDHLVATHYDADHIGGHAAIIDEFGSDRIGKVHGPDMSGVKDSNSETMKNFKNSLEENKIAGNTFQEGDRLHINDVNIDVFNPSSDNSSKSRNENSVVMHCTYGEQSVLLAGDIEHGTEARLVEEYPDKLGQVDAVKIAHHGSKKATGDEFLAACEMETAIFSHAEQNSEDHPHKETLYRTAEGTDTAVSTALHGSTVLDFDGENTITLQNETSTANFAVMTRYCREHDEDFDTTLVEENALAYEDLPRDIPLGIVDDTSNVKPLKEVQKLQEDKEDLLDKNEKLQDENEELREQVDELRTTLNDFIDTNQPETDDEASTAAELTDLTPAEQVRTIITDAETTEDVRQTLDNYPDASAHLREVTKTDSNEHVPRPMDVQRNRRAYKKACAASPPVRDRFWMKVPSAFGGMDADQPDPTPEELGIGPIERPSAVAERQTAAEKRKTGFEPSPELQAAEEQANTAVENADNVGELCWGLRQTHGAHKDFLRNSLPSRHIYEFEVDTDQTTAREVSNDRDNNKNRGI